MVRASILCLYALLASFGIIGIGHARVVTAREALGRACALASSESESVAFIAARRHLADCSARPTGSARIQWAVFNHLDFVATLEHPVQFVHAISPEEGEAVYTLHADGRIRPSPTSPADARQVMRTTDVAFRIADSPSPVRAILVRTVAFQSQLSLAPRAAIESLEYAEATARLCHFLYGAIGALLITLLAYNLMLYAVLRHRFLFFYCLLSGAMFLYGVVWSGAIFLLAPGMTSSMQEAMIFLTISMILLTGPPFMFSFVEPGMIPAWLQRLIYCAAFLTLASALTRIADPDLAPRFMDFLSYGGVCVEVAGVFWASAVAWRNGSHAIKIFLIGWSWLMLLGLLRAFSGLGFKSQDSALSDIIPFAAMAVEAAINTAAMVVRIRGLQSKLHQAVEIQAQLKILAETDPMTGLLNRRAFLDYARDGGYRKRLILSDIDRFKSINDSHGHDMGDRVIIAVASALQRVSPPGALVGRIGGEEFAVLVPADAPRNLAERLRKAIETPAFEGGPPVTISAGVAENTVSDEEDWRFLYIAADEALYEAKRAGRNRVHSAVTKLERQRQLV